LPLGLPLDRRGIARYPPDGGVVFALLNPYGKALGDTRRTDLIALKVAARVRIPGC